MGKPGDGHQKCKNDVKSVNCVRPNGHNELQTFSSREAVIGEQQSSSSIPNGEEVIEADGEEAAAVKVAPDPGQPSKADIERHEATHAEYRSWCPHCVRGRGVASGHSRKAWDGNPCSIPEVVMDYCFPSQGNE